MTKIIFVGGTGRSGTSIVKKAIANHPQAASLPFEYRFIIDPDGLLDFYASYPSVWSPYIADRRLKRLHRLLNNLAQEPLSHKLFGRLIQWGNRDGKNFSPRTYHGWALSHHLPNFESHIQELMSSLVEFSFPACWVGTESYQRFPKIIHSPPRSRLDLAVILGRFIQNVVKDLLEKTNKQFFVEDNTWNILFAREIIDLLPNAKIIHVYRDPRDVVASLSQQRWAPTNKLQAAQWYRAMMSHWFDIRSALGTYSYYELSLEDFVEMPEKTLQNICEFCEITFDKTMLQLDISQSHRGRWRNDFTPAEKAKVDEILKDIILQLGYTNS